MTTENADPLREPLSIGRLTVPGRLFKSATSETRATDDGFVTEELLEFYRPMAAAATPLIVTGNLYVSLQGKSAGRQAGIDDDDKIPGLRDWVSLAHAGGTKLIAQLNHGGRQMPQSAIPEQRTVSASAVREPLYGTKPRPLRLDEITGVVRDFADAAERAQRAGFDGVQIHAAHGYLLGQFLTPHTNRRTDQYGGSLDNRMRLLREVYRAVRERVGADYPILLKMNGTDMLPLRRGATTPDLVAAATRMQDDGVDAVEISRGHYESWPGMILGHYQGFFRAQILHGSGTKMSRPRRLFGLAAGPLLERVAERVAPGGEGFNLPQAEQFSAALTIPVICVGGFHTAAGMKAALAAQRCDAVSAARAFIADPYLWRHVTGTLEPGAPVCGYHNGCIARFGGQPIDCYRPEIRDDKDRMLAHPPLPSPRDGAAL
ncbi:NADH:flavin oxidoreductase [Mycobacterium colombiense]|uniref:NADH:flavin oxidoreductase n=1 Tax=Mycobacterium colombiense TaxID=339268 RepID=A0A1A2YS20_9MYCO|nr:NADH:flavin oxidoreductase [Mycobacterium colombiense]OBI39716.1 NADH:flavin oxidoreductase [Mycobacterium colombiense]